MEYSHDRRTPIEMKGLLAGTYERRGDKLFAMVSGKDEMLADSDDTAGRFSAALRRFANACER